VSDRSSPAQPPKRAVPLEKVREAGGKKLVPVPRSKVASTRAFRRVRSDRIAGMVGVVLVVIAAILLFTWPQPQTREPPTFAVEWPQADRDAYRENLTLTRQASTITKDVVLGDANITRISLSIKWKDDVGDEEFEKDDISVELVAPPEVNRTLRINSSAGTTQFVEVVQNASISKTPDVREVPAATEAEARQKLGDHSTHNGTGTWKLRVTVVTFADDFHDNVTRSSGQPCPTQPPQGTPACTPDLQNLVEVRVSVRTYALQLTPPE
jgi:hypothetical protein